MIDYDVGKWGFKFVFRVHGSVFPKALVLAMPSAILAMTFRLMLHEKLMMDGMSDMWSGYTFVLGVLIVFRNNQAYARFWEGATLINQVRGEWFNAVSSLVAFSSRSPEKAAEVNDFHHLLVRLASVLYCSALQQVNASREDLDILDLDGIDEKSLAYLEHTHDRCEVLLQWIQRSIVEADEAEVITIPAPILSRAYQELSRGIVNLNNVRKIKEVPFPFPYAQMISCMMGIHWLVTPVLASQTIETWQWASLTTFFVQMALWSLLFIALEIDQPFGDDPNDLPLKEIQQDFNKSLLALLNPLAQKPPKYNRTAEKPTIRKSLSSDVVEEDFDDWSDKTWRRRHSQTESSKFFQSSDRPNGAAPVNLPAAAQRGDGDIRWMLPQRQHISETSSLPLFDDVFIGGDARRVEDREADEHAVGPATRIWRAFSPQREQAWQRRQRTNGSSPISTASVRDCDERRQRLTRFRAQSQPVLSLPDCANEMELQDVLPAAPVSLPRERPLRTLPAMGRRMPEEVREVRSHSHAGNFTLVHPNASVAIGA